MKYINTCIVKKFDIGEFNIPLPNFYTTYKEETKISYLLLNYMYYKIYNKFLDVKKIYRDENGKPKFLNEDIYFNISHSKNYVACSLAPVNIGIDIEEDRSIKNKILNKIINIDDKDMKPIQIWNIKEAYSKYLGIGLKLKFCKISIDEIKKNVNLSSSKYNIENSILYFSLCYNKDENLSNSLTFLNKDKLIDFYKLT
ncbi:4'-phosphopantetheinyl transferase family protein [[Clostridium] colinum]|uniref:4'-phosphopantetheinyl transferase family protein n=1 Tax=[Clostridium] colinum TaxID=36835 RepID=UPI0020257AE0|nr:4'-phosphopantetheinyl transferase superfamily protein [[Clostridium] colinum]